MSRRAIFVFYLFGPILLIGSIGMIGKGFFSYNTFQNLKNGTVTEASITHIQPACAECSSQVVSYEYFIDGQTYQTFDEHVEKGSLADSIQNQETARIYYIPDDPSKSLLVGNINSYKQDLEVGFVCAFVAIIALLGAEFGRWYNQRTGR